MGIANIKFTSGINYLLLSKPPTDHKTDIPLRMPAPDTAKSDSSREARLHKIRLSVPLKPISAYIRFLPFDRLSAD